MISFSIFCVLVVTLKDSSGQGLLDLDDVINPLQPSLLDIAEDVLSSRPLKKKPILRNGPKCIFNHDRDFCLVDPEYPKYEIQRAAEHHLDQLLPLYAEVGDKKNFKLISPNHEDTLCPSDSGRVRVLRAKNTHGKWKIIVNNIKAHYTSLTQTTRLEECLEIGVPCPLLPKCYESDCAQKFVIHRLLTFNPYERYFPFAIDTFRLPSSCSCVLGELDIQLK